MPFIVVVSLFLVVVVGWLFIWAVRNDQYEDLEGPAWTILQDDDEHPPVENNSGATAGGKTGPSRTLPPGA